MKLNLNMLLSGFLHRAADLTLVPSAAIGKDLIAAGATAGEERSYITFLYKLYDCSKLTFSSSFFHILKLINFDFGIRVSIQKASIPVSVLKKCV